MDYQSSFVAISANQTGILQGKDLEGGFNGKSADRLDGNLRRKFHWNRGTKSNRDLYSDLPPDSLRNSGFQLLQRGGYNAAGEIKNVFSGRTFWQGENQLLEFVFAEGEIKEYELKLLQYCNIKGLLKPIVRRQEGQLFLQYNITGAELIKNEEAVRDYLNGLCAFRAKLAEYLLDLAGVLVFPQYSFYFGQGEWRFVYLPLQDKSRNQDLSFFRSFFLEKPELFLQMEMMGENPAMTLADYIDVLTNV